MRHPAKSVALSLALALTLSAGISSTRAESGPPAAEIRDLAGTPTLFVNGKPHSPLMFFGTLQVGGGPVLEEVRLAAKADVHIHSFGVPMPWAAEGETPDYAPTDACLDAVLEADPDALLLPRFGMDPPAAWTQQHPSEAMLYDNGSRGRASVASETWRREANLSLRRFVEHVESKYGRHVIGYHPCGQHTGEWFYDETWTGLLSGFEPAFEQGFRALVRNKYAGNRDALRRAWRDEAATFDAIRAPTKEERTRAALGVFHDPTSEKKLIDWHEYQQIAMVEPLEQFARTIKEATKGKKLVVYFYGYLFEISDIPHGPQASGHLAMARLLQCPDVDIVCSPISYGDRGLVGSTPFMVAVDSVRLHGKLWLNEDDTRTWLASADSGFGRVDTPEQTRWVHLRNFGPLLTRRITCWWMDLPGEGWLKSDAIWSTLGELKRLYDRDLGKPSRYSPQIAVIVDEKSLLCLASSRDVTHPLLSALRIQFNRIGAPVGIYLLSDLTAGRVPEAKMYLFPNAFALTADERAALARTLHRDGKVAVWLYGAGFIQDTADTKNMSDLLEMPIEASMKPESLQVQLGRADDPLLAGIAGQSLAAPGKLAPMLTVAEQAAGCRVIGRLQESGRSAVVAKQARDYTTVYVGTLTASAGFLRNCARQAGVFLYVESDETLQTDGHWLTISATSAGKKEIRLPRSAVVRDALGGEIIGTNIDHWSADMKPGETRIYEIQP